MAGTGYDRLMGWKAIGSFVGRDARTMRRWETERGLPVYRAPGSGSGSVWASKEELQTWMAGVASAPGRSDPAIGPAAQPRPARHGRAVAAIALLAAASLPLVMSNRATSEATSAPYGVDGQANETYRAARYAMSTRSVAGLVDAQQKFSALAAAHPDNAQAFAGMAETNLLLREFASIPEEIAYRRADFAARKALALDPNSAGALRSMGFIKYWSNGERGEGLELLRRAITQAPDDAQAYHWYGTALLGEGRYGESLAALEQAHALTPGSSAISADEAMVRFVKGEHLAALDSLRQITRVDPEFSGAHSYLARLYLIEGDDAGFLTEAAIAARLKRDTDQAAILKAAAEAFRTGGHTAMMASLVATAEDTFERSGEGAILIAMLHAVDGERQESLEWLTRAEAIREPAIRSLKAAAEFVPYQDDPAFKHFLNAR